MKKLITLLIAFTAVSSVFAQTSRDEARRVILGQPKNTSGTYPNQYPNNGRDVVLGGGNNNSRYPSTYPTNSRGTEIDRINREYDAKIYSIRNNRYLSPAEKERMIRQLEAERNSRIREARNYGYNNNNRNNRRYDNDRRHDDDDYRYRNNKNYKKDNGKHLGWEKGKGNPHKNGGKNWKD